MPDYLSAQDLKNIIDDLRRGSGGSLELLLNKAMSTQARKMPGTLDPGLPNLVDPLRNSSPSTSTQ